MIDWRFKECLDGSSDKKTLVRRSHWSCSIKKAVLENFAIFTGGNLLLIKFIKRDSNSVVFL